MSAWTLAGGNRTSPNQQIAMSQRRTDPDDDGGVRMPLDDARVPLAVRLIGEAMAPPAPFVEIWGHEEYALLSSEGEVLDVIWFVAPRAPSPFAVAIGKALQSLPAASVHIVPFVLVLVLPSVYLLHQAWRTQSFHLLMAGLLMSVVTALVFVIWRILKA